MKQELCIVQKPGKEKCFKGTLKSNQVPLKQKHCLQHKSKEIAHWLHPGVLSYSVEWQREVRRNQA
jgi:hypothetical protein